MCSVYIAFYLLNIELKKKIIHLFLFPLINPFMFFINKF